MIRDSFTAAYIHDGRRGHGLAYSFKWLRVAERDGIKVTRNGPAMRRISACIPW